jgi:hypothetical protein
MAMHKTWFVPRQKRQLTLIVDYLAAFDELIVGKVWKGNRSLQQDFEDKLGERGLRNVGALRARGVGDGGGGARTTFAQMMSLGLIFFEPETKIVRFTYAGENIVTGAETFVDVMRDQILKFQYPSYKFWSGSSAVDHRFSVHPFWFLLKLLSDSRLGGYVTVDEVAKIVIIEADSDEQSCVDKVVTDILAYRNSGGALLPHDLDDFGEKIHKDAQGHVTSDSFHDIADTVIAYLDVTQFIIRADGEVRINPSNSDLVSSAVSLKEDFIKNPDNQEVFQRRYGLDRGHTKDNRKFVATPLTAAEVKTRRIKSAFVALAMKRPIASIDTDILNSLSSTTGYKPSDIDPIVQTLFPNGAIDGFLASYREMAFSGRENALDFEKATCELFKVIFHFSAKHVGPLGNTPDVYIESSSGGYCAIIDDKAYPAYSISGDHFRRMKDVYIPTVGSYGGASYPLAFYMYIAGGFKSTIDARISELSKETAVDGCAITADLIIAMVQKNKTVPYSHSQLRNIFSLNRRVSSLDL